VIGKKRKKKKKSGGRTGRTVSDEFETGDVTFLRTH
jgi:hypothetical protein